MTINHPSTDVDSPSAAYNSMSNLWTLPDVLMDGEDTLKRYTTTYLPQNPQEVNKAYELRLARSRLFNVYRHAVKNLTGRVYSNDIVFNDDVLPEIEKWWENMDLQGNDGNAFFRNVFEDGINRGLSHVYVDYPRTEQDLTYAEEKTIRPYCVHVEADKLIKAVAANINGKLVLVRAHIKESYIRSISKWDEVEDSQYRVLYPGRWELYRQQVQKDGSLTGKYEIVDEGETGLDFIPLYTFYANKVKFQIGRPTLEELAYLNLGHYQQYSDYLNIIHYANVPILYASGFNQDKIKSTVIGPNKIFHGPEGSELKYVEHSGDAIGSAQKELVDMEKRMAFASFEPMVQSPDRETYGAHAIDTSQSNSGLHDIALRHQDTINNVLDAMAKYRNKEKGGSVVVNRDFGLRLRDREELKLFVEMAKDRLLSTEDLYKEFKRRQVLAEDFDVAGSISKLSAEREEKNDIRIKDREPGEGSGSAT